LNGNAQLYTADLMSLVVTELIPGDLCWISTLTLNFVAAGVVVFCELRWGWNTEYGALPQTPGFFEEWVRALGFGFSRSSCPKVAGKSLSHGARELAGRRSARL